MARRTAYVRNVVVYDSIMYARGHNIRRWAEALDRRFTANARRFAPVNKRTKDPRRAPPGALKRSISGDVARRGPRHLQMRISIKVHYARWVIQGTGPYIDAGGKPMKIWNAHPHKGRPSEVNQRYFYRQMVRGQKPNNFLDLAHAATAARHPSLRGVFRSPIGRYSR